MHCIHLLGVFRLLSPVCRLAVLIIVFVLAHKKNTNKNKAEEEDWL